MKKGIISLILVALLAMALFGCSNNDAGTQQPAEPAGTTEGSAAASAGGAASGGDGEYFFALSHFGDANAWNVAQLDDFETVAAERGYKYTMANCQGDINKQLSDVADLLLQEPDALILGPTQIEGLAPALQMAKEAGVPVFLINRACEGEAGVDYVTLVGCDPHKIGYAQGQATIDAFGEDAEVRIVELSGTPGATNTIGFAEGFREAIADCPGYEIIVSQVTNFNVAEAQVAMENIVQSLGVEGFDCIFGHQDTDGIAAISVLEENGGVPGLDPSKGEIVITTNGRTQDGLFAVEAGKIAADVDWEARIAAQVYDTILDYFNGAELETFIYVPSETITLGNIEDWIDKGF